jgi:phosphatidylinositol-bisphosphatase
VNPCLGSNLERQEICINLYKGLKFNIHDLHIQGSVSVSMLLHKTTFCFICSHLTSGHTEGDESRRNWDVTEIIKRTRFPAAKVSGVEVPETIWDHE